MAPYLAMIAAAAAWVAIAVWGLMPLYRVAQQADLRQVKPRFRVADLLWLVVPLQLTLALWSRLSVGRLRIDDDPLLFVATAGMPLAFCQIVMWYGGVKTLEWYRVNSTPRRAAYLAGGLPAMIFAAMLTPWLAMRPVAGYLQDEQVDRVSYARWAAITLLLWALFRVGSHAALGRLSTTNEPAEEP